MALPTTYEYKIFRHNIYLGSLPDVVSPFQYSLDINNGSAPLQIVAKVQPIGANLPLATLDTELGVPITTELDDPLLLESAPVTFGPSTSGRLIANDNDILVYEFSSDYPSGKLVYSGWITSLNIQHAAAQVVINCMSYGMDLNDSILQSGTTYTAQITQDTDSSITETFGFDGYQLAQTFTPAGAFNIGKIQLYMQNSLYATFGNQIAQLDLYQGTPGSTSTLLGTAQTTITNGTLEYKDFAFSSPIALAASTQYYFVMTNATRVDDYGTMYVATSIANPYASGEMWYKQPSTAPWAISSTEDMRFKVYSADATVVSPYSSQDPTNIFKGIIDDYHSRGGKANYSGSSTTLTGLSLSYTFNFSRTLDAIKKALDLAPANWYWTVDPATSTAYFKSFNTTADVVLKFGTHIADLDLGINAEGVRNVLYFTGGPTAGVNLFKKYTNSTSLSNVGRQRLETQTDNRVTVSATADAIADAFLDAVASEIYETTVEVERVSGLDITTILPGQTVGFSGTGTFVDFLVLNIVRMTRFPDKVQLTLGSIPPRATSVLKELENNITDLQTLANPASPS